MNYGVGDTPRPPPPQVFGPFQSMEVQKRGMTRIPDGQNLVDPVVLATDRLAVYRSTP